MALSSSCMQMNKCHVPMCAQVATEALRGCHAESGESPFPTFLLLITTMVFALVASSASSSVSYDLCGRIRLMFHEWQARVMASRQAVRAFSTSKTAGKGEWIYLWYLYR